MNKASVTLFYRPFAYSEGVRIEGPITTDKREAYEWAASLILSLILAHAGPFPRQIAPETIDKRLRASVDRVELEVLAKKLGNYDNPITSLYREKIYDSGDIDPLGRSWILWAAQAVAEDREEAGASHSPNKDTLFPRSFGNWILKKRKGGDENEDS